jgi:diguanylate cyclase (GGDEF)-like protein
LCDDVLIALGRLLNENTRGADLAARYGGEEFAVLLPNTNKQWAIFMAERLRTIIENTKWPQRVITASFGVTTFHESQFQGDAGRRPHQSHRSGALPFQASGP